jgi:hypothetical protein
MEDQPRMGRDAFFKAVRGEVPLLPEKAATPASSDLSEGKSMAPAQWLSKVKDADEHNTLLSAFQDNEETRRAREQFEEDRLRQIEEVKAQVRDLGERMASVSQSSTTQSEPQTPAGGRPLGERVVDKVIDRGISTLVGAGAGAIGAAIEDLTDKREEQQPTVMDPGVANNIRAMVGLGTDPEEIVEDFKDMGYTGAQLAAVERIARRAAEKASQQRRSEPEREERVQRPAVREQQEAPIKQQEPVRESKERPAGNWEDMQAEIAKITETEGTGGYLQPSQIRRRSSLETTRNGIWQGYKDKYPDESEQIHMPWKDHVADLVDGVIRIDAQNAEDRRQMPSANFDRNNPLKMVTQSLDQVTREIDGMNNRPEEESIRRDWYRGVKRNVELSAYKAELALYRELKLEGQASFKDRIDELNGDIKRLETEVAHLNWGTLSDMTIKRLSELSAAYTGYLQDTGSRAPELKAAREELARKEKEAQEGQKTPRTPENGVSLEQVNNFLIPALIEGGWQDSGAQGDRSKVRLWIASHGTHPEVSRVKAQEALIEWAEGISGDFLPAAKKAATASGLDSERMEALESNPEMLKAKKAVLEFAGFNFDAQVDDGHGGRRKITGADIARGNFPKDGQGNLDMKQFLDKTGADPSHVLFMRDGKPVTFWNLKPNDFRPAFEMMRERTARELSMDKDDPHVVLVTITALRQLQHTGILNYFHTEYSPHPFLSKEMTAVMHPGDAYLKMLESNAAELRLEGGERPGHYSFISNNRNLFVTRDFETGLYPQQKDRRTGELRPAFRPVPGYQDVGWNEMVFPPEPLVPYAVAGTMFADGSTMWDHIAEGRLVQDRKEFHNLGPTRIAGFARSGAVKLLENLWQPIKSDKLINPNSDFLKRTGERVGESLKDFGKFVGDTPRIRETLAKPETEKLKNDLARFYMTRGMVFAQGAGTEGKLNLWRFDTEVMAIALEGYVIDKSTARHSEKKSPIKGDMRYDYSGRLSTEGWKIKAVSTDDHNETEIQLTDQRMVDWLRTAGQDYPRDAVHSLFPEVIDMLGRDNVALALIHSRTAGIPDEPIPGWGNITLDQAFRRGYEISKSKGRFLPRESLMIWGVGARNGQLENLMPEIVKIREDRVRQQLMGMIHLGL